MLFRSKDLVDLNIMQIQGSAIAKLENGRWSFTTSGFLLSNVLIGALLEAQTQHKLSGNPWLDRPLFDDDPSVEIASGGRLFAQTAEGLTAEESEIQ